MAAYEVELKRDDGGAWLARVPSVPGCHTYGRSIEQALNRTREALSLWVSDAESAELLPAIALPAAVRVHVRRLSAARERAERATEEATGELRETVRELTHDEGWSRRDVAAVIGLSPQRIQQVSEAIAASSFSARAGTPKKAIAKKASARKRAAKKS